MITLLNVFFLSSPLLIGCGSDTPKDIDPNHGDARMEGTEPGDCTDGADNDGDTFFDCNDDGCAGAPDCVDADADADTDADADADADAEADADADADADAFPYDETSEGYELPAWFTAADYPCHDGAAQAVVWISDYTTDTGSWTGNEWRVSFPLRDLTESEMESEGLPGWPEEYACQNGYSSTGVPYTMSYLDECDSEFTVSLSNEPEEETTTCTGGVGIGENFYYTFTPSDSGGSITFESNPGEDTTWWADAECAEGEMRFVNLTCVDF